MSIKRFWVGYFKNQHLCIVDDYLLAKIIPSQIGYQVFYCFRDAKSAQSVCTNFQISVIWYPCDIEPLFLSFFLFKTLPNWVLKKQNQYPTNTHHNRFTDARYTGVTSGHTIPWGNQNLIFVVVFLTNMWVQGNWKDNNNNNNNNNNYYYY